MRQADVQGLWARSRVGGTYMEGRCFRLISKDGVQGRQRGRIAMHSGSKATGAAGIRGSSFWICLYASSGAGHESFRLWC